MPFCWKKNTDQFIISQWVSYHSVVMEIKKNPKSIMDDYLYIVWQHSWKLFEET